MLRQEVLLYICEDLNYFISCISFHSLQLITCKCSKSCLLTIAMVMVCTDTEFSTPWETWFLESDLQNSPLPQTFAPWPLCLPTMQSECRVKQTFPRLNTPPWPFRFHDLVGIRKSGQGFFGTVFQDWCSEFHLDHPSCLPRCSMIVPNTWDQEAINPQICYQC